LKKSKLTKILSLAVVLPVGVVMVTFAVVNRHAVSLDFWPLNQSLDVPLSAVLMGTLMIGVAWGGIASWLAAGAARWRAREATRRAERAEAENRGLKDRVSRLEAEVQGAKATPADVREGEARAALPPADAA